MPSLQVRDLPHDVYVRLQERAGAEHRSIAQETVVLLRIALGLSESKKAERRAFIERARRREPQAADTLPSSGQLIREDRER